MATLAQPPQGVSTGPQLDNRRIAAALIDLGVPALMAALAFAAGLSLTRGVLLVAVGWTLYYFFALESDQGQTLGKRVMNLRVLSADGSPASMEQIAKRTLVRVLDGHIVGLIVMLASGERRQRLGDMVAGTIVTEAEATPRAPAAASMAPELASAPVAASPEASQSESVPWHKRSLKMPALPKRPKKNKSSTPAGKRSLSLPSLGKRSLSLPSLGKRSLSLPSLGERSRRQEDLLPIPVALSEAEPVEPVEPVELLEPTFERDELLEPLPIPDETYELHEDAQENWEPEPIEPAPIESYPEPAAAFDDEPSADFEELDYEEYDVQEVRRHDDEPDSDGDTEPAAIQWHVDHADDEVDESAHEGGTIKPIEIVSDMDLVMQDAEERHPGSP